MLFWSSDSINISESEVVIEVILESVIRNRFFDASTGSLTEPPHCEAIASFEEPTWTTTTSSSISRCRSWLFKGTVAGVLSRFNVLSTGIWDAVVLKSQPSAWSHCEGFSVSMSHSAIFTTASTAGFSAPWYPRCEGWAVYFTPRAVGVDTSSLQVIRFATFDPRVAGGFLGLSTTGFLQFKTLLLPLAFLDWPEPHLLFAVGTCLLYTYLSYEVVDFFSLPTCHCCSGPGSPEDAFSGLFPQIPLFDIAGTGGTSGTIA